MEVLPINIHKFVFRWHLCINVCRVDHSKKPSAVSTCKGQSNVQPLHISLSKVGPNLAESCKRTALGDLKQLSAVIIMGQRNHCGL